MCQLDRLPADQARELNARYRKDGHAMCSNDEPGQNHTVCRYRPDMDDPFNSNRFGALALACSGNGTDDAADQTPPAGRSPEPYGRDFGSRLPRFFDRAILAIASAVAFVVGWTVRGPEAR